MVLRKGCFSSFRELKQFDSGTQLQQCQSLSSATSTYPFKTEFYMRKDILWRLRIVFDIFLNTFLLQLCVDLFLTVIMLEIEAPEISGNYQLP